MVAFVMEETRVSTLSESKLYETLVTCNNTRLHWFFVIVWLTFVPMTSLRHGRAQQNCC